MRLHSPTLAGLCAILVLALGLHGALAATGVVPSSRAGDGARAVGGFTISQVGYTLSTADPSRAGTVTFRLNRATGQAFAQFPTVSTAWTACVISGAGRVATCTPTGGVPLAAISRLRVAAAF